MAERSGVFGPGVPRSAAAKRPTGASAEVEPSVQRLPSLSNARAFSRAPSRRHSTQAWRRERRRQSPGALHSRCWRSSGHSLLLEATERYATSTVLVSAPAEAEHRDAHLRLVHGANDGVRGDHALGRDVVGCRRRRPAIVLDAFTSEAPPGPVTFTFASAPAGRPMTFTAIEPTPLAPQDVGRSGHGSEHPVVAGLDGAAHRDGAREDEEREGGHATRSSEWQALRSWWIGHQHAQSNAVRRVTRTRVRHDARVHRTGDEGRREAEKKA